MFLKRVNGPRTVRLPDGSVMTRADLPPADTRRWVASRKAAVVRGVEAGLITADEACARYGLSAEELDSWRRAVARHGPQALKATAVQRYRQLPVEKNEGEVLG
jgi:hypothetical protein